MKPSSPPRSVSLPATNHGTSTYDEIMDTLRLLEAEPPSLEHHSSTDKHTSRELLNQTKNTEDVNFICPVGLSEDKVHSILSYLDQVEKVEVDRSKYLAQRQSDLHSESTDGAKLLTNHVKYVDQLIRCKQEWFVEHGFSDDMYNLLQESCLLGQKTIDLFSLN